MSNDFVEDMYPAPREGSRDSRTRCTILKEAANVLEKALHSSSCSHGPHASLVGENAAIRMPLWPPFPSLVAVSLSAVISVQNEDASASGF